ncbi:MAG: HDIG domain-containing protein [Candidatus Aenigmarchaeota archaeon]|nr:HDIG domain-containing protein [Candidatus Aenigmarchaeota archaeon]
MQKDEALEIMKQHLKKDFMVKHSLAVAAIMKKIAGELGEDCGVFETLGLLHDIDFEKISSPAEHTLVTEALLKGKIADEMIRSIKSHNFEHTNVKPEKNIEHALIAADAVSGLVVAAALVMPSKKLADVRLDTLKAKFKSKEFARKCDRSKILYCEKFGLPLEKFLELSLAALQEISGELGL